MKVLIDGRLLAKKPTGISRYTEELIASYRKRYGMDNVYVLCLPDSYYEGENRIITKCKPFNLFHLFRLYFELAEYTFDVYHAAFYSGVAIRPKGMFIVITFHDLMFYRVPGFFSGNVLVNLMARFYYYILVKLSLRTADLVVSVSKTTSEDLQRIYNKASIVIPEGVSYELGIQEMGAIDMSALEGLDVAYKRYFLYVGNNRRHKNIVFLKEAFKKSGVEGKLLLVGFQDPMEGDDRIVNVPWVDDHLLKILYNGCIAFVFPSLYEGFGLPILEAISNKTLVYSSSAGALKEFGFNSVKYFDPNELDELVNLFRNWTEYSFDESDIARLSNYRWESNFERFQDKLENLI